MSSYFDNKPVFMEPQVNQYSSHMVMTNVSQESKTKIVNIDTKFRDDFNYDTACNLADYAISLPEPINNVCSMSVENLELPLSYYNISSALGNNCFKLTHDHNGNSNSAVIIIPDGEYTINTLQTTLNDLMTNNFNHIDFTIDTHTTIKDNSSSGGECYIEFAVNKDGTFDKHNFKSKLGWMLGFTQIDYTLNRTTITTIVSERLCTISRPRVLYLQLDDFVQTKQNSFSTMMARSRNSDNIIAKIMVDRNENDFRKIFFANKANGYLLSDKREYSGKTNINRLQIQLVDEFDQKVNLNGLDFSFSLRIEHL